jgi:hypothetical protein
MLRNTVIVEKHDTKSGDVDVVIEVNVHGPPDGVAQVDRALQRHLRERDESEAPVKRQVHGETIPSDGETAQSFEEALRKPPEFGR